MVKKKMLITSVTCLVYSDTVNEVSEIELDLTGIYRSENGIVSDVKKKVMERGLDLIRILSIDRKQRTFYMSREKFCELAETEE